MGVSDWTPYAQAMKNKGVKGLIFYGDFKQLAKLESVLTAMEYKLDWIDTNNNAYGQQFIDLAGFLGRLPEQLRRHEWGEPLQQHGTGDEGTARALREVRSRRGTHLAGDPGDVVLVAVRQGCGRLW